jgi:hypothetical protein
MAMGTDTARQAFAAVNATIATSASPDAFAAEIRSEMVKWTQLKSEILALPQSTRRDHS